MAKGSDKAASGDTAFTRELRRKFIASAMVAVALVLVGIVVGLDWAVYSRLCSRADAQLEALAESGGSFEKLIGEGSIAPSDGGDPAAQGEGASSGQSSGQTDAAEDGGAQPPATTGIDLDDQFGFSEETPYEMRFFVVSLDEDGEVVSVDVTRIVSVSSSEAADLAQAVSSGSSTSGFSGNLRYLIEEQDDGTTLCLFLDCSRDLASFHSVVLASVIVAAGALVLVFVLVFFFSKRAVAPVVESYERQRRFITDASHDLKTPLAVIDSSADVLEIENGPSEWIDSIHSQVERMSDLTNKLVVLARMDEGSDTLSPTDFDLAELASKVADDFDPVAVAGDHEIVCDASEKVPCHADIAMVEQAISLLIDNALKYSPDGAPVSITCARARKGKASVSVENPCEPLEPGDHAELFERFYRSDESRTSGSGHGIGLAVVRAIAEAHGGRVEATSPDGASLRITITL
jgi:two-component system sensor histidine kinase CiaH